MHPNARKVADAVEAREAQAPLPDAGGVPAPPDTHATARHHERRLAERMRSAGSRSVECQVQRAAKPPPARTRATARRSQRVHTLAGFRRGQRCSR